MFPVVKSVELWRPKFRPDLTMRIIFKNKDITIKDY